MGGGRPGRRAARSHVLAECFRQTPRLNRDLRSRYRSVSAHNSAEIDRRVTLGQNIVTGLTITRDVSATIFMACIPASGLGIGAAMAARLAGSVFQGIGTYQDTGNIGAAVVNANFAFVGSLMSLPDSAGRLARVVFTIHNTTNTVVRNSAISLMTGARGSSFTGVLREQLVSELGGQASGALMSRIDQEIAGAALPVIAGQFSFPGGSGGGGAAQTPGQAALSFDARGIAASRRQAEFRQQLARARRARSEAEMDRAMRATPFYRYLETGDPTELMTQAERHVRGYVLRPT